MCAAHHRVEGLGLVAFRYPVRDVHVVAVARIQPHSLTVRDIFSLFAERRDSETKWYLLDARELRAERRESRENCGADERVELALNTTRRAVEQQHRKFDNLLLRRTFLSILGEPSSRRLRVKRVGNLLQGSSG